MSIICVVAGAPALRSFKADNGVEYWSQEVWIYEEGKPFPTQVRAPLESKAAAYPEGQYTLASVRVRDGGIRVGKLLPIAKQQVEKPRAAI